MELDAIAIVGPTASGKTKRAVDIARILNGEIISADSRQIYRGMTIGTGKDLCEYGEIPYHLIDIVPAGTKYNLHRYLQDFHKALSDIKNRKKMPVICGGTGMYVENALNGIIMPEVEENPTLRTSLEGKSIDELEAILRSYKTLHNKTDIDNCKRAIRAIEIEEYYLQHPEEAAASRKQFASPLNAIVIGIDIPREERRKRITSRLKSRLEEGMVDEVRKLLDSGIPPEDLIYYGLEYKFVTMYIIGKYTYEEMFVNLETAIHQFAKRQMTWFRGMEKRGTKINWLPWNLSESDFETEVRALIKN
jgi:tRNA dimethylallyltransferase